MASIYHFFRALVAHREAFKTVDKLEEFPFDVNLLSCRNDGVFPDMAIRLNKGEDRQVFTGGELIELKDSDSFTVSSFNSTIPSRTKEISKIIHGENSSIKRQMEEAGDDINSVPVREVFYLVRGKKKGNVKVCLVYGSFFETIGIDKLISQSFSQVLEESLQQTGEEVYDELKQTLLSIFSEQENFSKTRTVEKASVKLRFRVMTEVNAEGNILNDKKYPEIENNTLSFLVPCHNDEEEQKIKSRLGLAFSEPELHALKIFKIKHHFNGYFLVAQISL